MRARTFSQWIAATLVIAGSSTARADDFAKQSPGALSGSHASLDDQGGCTSCHVDGGEVSRAKCLGCHSDQKRRIDAGTGLHASAKVAGKSCRTCHLEHRGRGHDVMGWATLGARESFDHDALTAFPLEGRHDKVACNDCHKRKSRAGVRLYMGEKRACESCHRHDSPHGFDASSKMKCERCHGQSAWQPATTARFDHDRDTDFRIEGSHQDVACSKCHPRERFNLGAGSAKCAGCHPSPHAGHLFGTKPCELCHSPRLGKLDRTRFDHRRKTRFALSGKHATTGCYGCHTKGSTRKPKRECSGCHADDSRHGDRFAQFGSPPDCNRCHAGSARWKPAVFDHDDSTRFKLTGKHARTPCRKCHRGDRPDRFERFDATTVKCRGCHQHAKVHDGEFADDKCLGCHKAPGVITPTAGARDRFHGPGARFPLNGAHSRVGCDSCHANDRWKGVSPECGPACHQDSLHRGTLGGKCTRCHSGGVWDATRFDHATQSRFALRGFHAQVECVDCHPKQAFKPRPTGCAGCHQQDDAHNGKLGRDCARCHRVTGAVVFDHNRQAAFALQNKHTRVPCGGCHPTMEFKPRPKQCAGCHPEPEVHRGRYGTRCQSCHDTKGWEGNAAVHDVGNFSLEGAHDSVSCERCHPGGKKRAGTGNLCITCHREDDEHANSLGGQCGRCHTQWSFAPAQFDHTTVGCDLQGVHRTLPCYDCHKSGGFGAITSQCYGCHRDEVIGDPLHRGSAFFVCGDCHNLNFWLPANDAPARTNSVCR